LSSDARRDPDARATERSPVDRRASWDSSGSVPRLACQRCGFPVPDRAYGCKHPCANCGTVYPLGDCSD